MIQPLKVNQSPINPNSKW